MAASVTQARNQGSYALHGHPSPVVEDIESFPRINAGVESTPATGSVDFNNHTQGSTAQDPFASQRSGANDSFKDGMGAETAPVQSNSPILKERRLSSDEWG